MLKLWLAVLVAVLISVTGGTPSHAQDDPCLNKGGRWNAETEQCEFSASFTINMVYPLDLASEHEVVAATVDEFFSASYMAFLQDAQSMGVAYQGFAPWALDVDYTLYTHSATYTTLKFDIYVYTGGAHGNSYFTTFTFDLDEARVLTLADIFDPETNPWAIITPFVQADLAEQLGEDADTEWIASGTSDDPINYQNFALTETSIIFFFPPYQVAAYAWGPQQVEIPLTELASVLNPAFVPVTE